MTTCSVNEDPTWLTLPVLFDEDLQSLPVGQHDVRVDAEVVVTASVLTTEVPDTHTQTHTNRKLISVHDTDTQTTIIQTEKEKEREREGERERGRERETDSETGLESGREWKHVAQIREC